MSVDNTISLPVPTGKKTAIIGPRSEDLKDNFPNDRQKRCYNSDKLGHFSSNCPWRKSASSGSSIPDRVSL